MLSGLLQLKRPRINLMKLYGALVLAVLMIAGCGRDRSSDAPDLDTTVERETQDDPAASRADERGDVATDSRSAAGVILFLGNSLSAGYGVRRAEAFPSLIQDRIDSLGWNFRVVNAGVSGDTSSGGLRRLDWLLRDRVDVLVLELGANDGLRGIPPAAMRSNLAEIIDRARARYPDIRIVLVGMKMPPNLGSDYTRAYEQVFVELAREKQVDEVPFLLENVGGVVSLNQPDGIHPTAEGHRIMAENVWRGLEPVLQDLREEDSSS